MLQPRSPVEIRIVLVSAYLRLQAGSGGKSQLGGKGSKNTTAMRLLTPASRCQAPAVNEHQLFVCILSSIAQHTHTWPASLSTILQPWKLRLIELQKFTQSYIYINGMARKSHPLACLPSSFTEAPCRDTLVSCVYLFFNSLSGASNVPGLC